MEIVCPDCDARYALPDGQIAPGRRVRCARCGQSWTPVEPPAGEPEPSRPAPLAQPPVPPPSPERDRFPALGWLLTLLIIALLAFAAWHFRARIEQLWPPSTRLYRLLGL